jgi:hypothetical protein
VKIASCIVVWTPAKPQYPPGFQGKVRWFPLGTPEDQVGRFACRGGYCHAGAHAPALLDRQLYVVHLGRAMIERDGLPVSRVHAFLAEVSEEYRLAVSDELFVARARRGYREATVLSTQRGANG